MAILFLGSFLIVPILMILLTAVLGAVNAGTLFVNIISIFDSFAVIYIILAVLLLWFICSRVEEFTPLVFGFFNIIMWACACMAIGQSIQTNVDTNANVIKTANAFRIFGLKPDFTVGTIIIASLAAIGYLSAIWAAVDSDDSKISLPISATSTAILAVCVESLFRVYSM